MCLVRLGNAPIPISVGASTANLRFQHNFSSYDLKNSYLGRIESLSRTWKRAK